MSLVSDSAPFNVREAFEGLVKNTILSGARKEERAAEASATAHTKKPVASPEKMATTLAPAVTEAMERTEKIAVVAIKPMRKSKLMWLNGVAATIFAGYLGIDLPQTPEEWATKIAAILVPVLTMLIKTYLTPTVSQQSVERASEHGGAV